jgi:hypothetical protein
MAVLLNLQDCPGHLDSHFRVKAEKTKKPTRLIFLWQVGFALTGFSLSL